MNHEAKDRGEAERQVREKETVVRHLSPRSVLLLQAQRRFR
jgi:hypothetical protein